MDANTSVIGYLGYLLGGGRLGPPMTVRTVALLSCVLACASGCGLERVDDVVWSDDGETTARLREGWSQPGLDGQLLWSQLAIGRPPFERRFERQEREQQSTLYPGDSLFYMRSRGYVLVHWMSTYTEIDSYDDRTGNRLWAWDGGAPILFAAPSPDGAIVAVVIYDFTECESHPVFCPDKVGDADVTLIDGDTGGNVAAVNIPVRDWGFIGADEYATWTPEGRLLVRNGPELVTAVLPDGSTEEAEMPDCWYPVTTSSPWDADGRPATDDTNPATLSRDGDPRSAQAFGCQ
jgi:hypothetical protein